MLKTKISYIKNKSNQKAKTLQSFCKYEQGRFNQAKYEQNYEKKSKHYHSLTQAQTDLRILQIKKKYGIYSKNQYQHQRYHSVFINSHQNKQNKQKITLKQRSLSSLQNISNQFHIQQINKSNQYKLKNKQITNKYNIQIPVSISLNKKYKTDEFQLSYNDTFSKQNLNKSKLKTQQNHRLSLINVQKVNNISYITQQSRYCRIQNNYKSLTQNYNPRIHNIDKINGKIKSALQNFQHFQKRDISIKHNNKVSNIKNSQSFQNKYQKLYKCKYNNQNDLIETRILNKPSIHNRTHSYIKDNYVEIKQSSKLKTQGDNIPDYKIKYNQITQIQNKNIIQTRQPSQLNNYPIKQNKLFSKIKILYDTSKQIQLSGQQYKIHQYNESSQNNLKQSNNQKINNDKNKVQSQLKTIQLRNSQLTPQKILKLNNIKSKYMNKISYRSAFTQIDNSHDKNKIQQDKIQEARNEKRMTTVRKLKSPQNKSFDIINIKQNRSQSYGDEIQQFDKNKDEINQLQLSKLQQIIKLTKSGIQTRKKTKQSFYNKTQYKQQNIYQNDFNQIQQLLKTQIQLDQQFRKAKYWFKYQKDNYKWQQIKYLLSNNINYNQIINHSNQNYHHSLSNPNHHHISIQQHLSNFQIIDEEIDPFFSLRILQFTYQTLVQKYINALNNWNNICKSGIINKMIKTYFIQYIDIDKKGFANLSDLTIFINSKSQAFYKNRDIALIFSRLIPKKRNLNILYNLNIADSQKINKNITPNDIFNYKLTHNDLKEYEIL